MDAVRRSETRREVLSVCLPLLAGVLLIGSILTLNSYHGVLLEWARQGVVETTVVVAGAVGATLVVMLLMLLGFALCRGLPQRRQ